jgi:ABC-type Fe3+ transport system substrate-binding protein
VPEAPPPEDPRFPGGPRSLRDAVGSTIEDRYILEGILGEGGMGVVFRAQQTSVHRPVAIKMLHPSLAGTAEFFHRFRREAELASRLHHPHIISVHDFGQTRDGACYYVMELLEGLSLREKVRTEGALSISRTVAIAAQIGRALAHAHQIGVVHRDLKPQNVMCTVVDGQDFVKVLDFGLVKSLETDTQVEAKEGLTTTGQVLGTPQYMAPEQAVGDQVDARADLYSLGVVTYFMLGGVTPYGQKTVHGALRAAATQPLPPVSARRPEAPVPESLEAFLRRAMAYDREERPASAEAFVRELEASIARVPKALLDKKPARAAVATDGAGSGTSRTRPWKEPLRWRRTALVALAAAGLAAGGYAGWRHFSRGPDDREGPLAGPTVPTLPVLIPAPPPEKVEIDFLYSTEKKRWIEAQTTAFASTHPRISVNLIGRGSVEAKDGILSGADKPTLWSPADSLVLNLAGSDWETAKGSPLFAGEGTQDAPQSLVLTPIVMMIWSDRAKVLEHLGKGQIDWRTLHDAAVAEKGWRSIGGKADWGALKVGHTSPARSNSGLQALLLMTLAYYGNPSRLTVDQLRDKGYQAWLSQLERSVAKFEASTGTFVTDVVRYGPSRYDVAIAYESLAIDQLENAQKHWTDMRIIYPSPTSWSDHPIALLEAPWVTPAQRSAAREYVAFLRSRPAQEQALAFGFRPADPSIAVKGSDPSNPFVRLAAAGARVDIPPAVVPPEPAVVREALRVWNEAVGSR